MYGLYLRSGRSLKRYGRQAFDSRLEAEQYVQDKHVRSDVIVRDIPKRGESLFGYPNRHHD